jgi:NAD(P)-dependent dehydrogenase (short-subunit alcohol dehydrogenase family)
MMNKVAIVSGSNQGLGFALVEALCKNLGSNAFVYLTARKVACWATGSAIDKGQNWQNNYCPTFGSRQWDFRWRFIPAAYPRRYDRL